MSENKESNKYVPYGYEWKREMKKWNKDQLIEMLGKVCNQKDEEDLNSRSFSTPGMKLISEERQRHIEVKGYNTFDDAGYTDEELTKAAICYLMPNDLKVPNEPLAIWPWQEKHYKPSPNNRIRELVKGSSLIVAEIDRLLVEEDQNK